MSVCISNGGKSEYARRHWGGKITSADISKRVSETMSGAGLISKVMSARPCIILKIIMSFIIFSCNCSPVYMKQFQSSDYNKLPFYES